eukprot:109266-Pleurochrysis_carterae.AAC.2
MGALRTTDETWSSHKDNAPARDVRGASDSLRYATPVRTRANGARITRQPSALLAPRTLHSAGS